MVPRHRTGNKGLLYVVDHLLCARQFSSSCRIPVRKREFFFRNGKGWGRRYSILNRRATIMKYGLGLYKVRVSVADLASSVQNASAKPILSRKALQVISHHLLARAPFQGSLKRKMTVIIMYNARSSHSAFRLGPLRHTLPLTNTLLVNS